MDRAEVNSVGENEAKTQFSHLLERVETGEEITITRHGHPVARLVPAQPGRSIDRRKEAITKMRELASRNRLDGLQIQDLISEGRK